MTDNFPPLGLGTLGLGPLGLDSDELVACVACGLCLPHCPTYRVTGLEIASPRGRIAAMRAVDERAAPIDDAFLRAMDECVQCRGCDAACPSGVQFGHLMEDTRAALVRNGWGRRAGFAERLAYRIVLPRHWLLLAGTWLVLVAQRLHIVPRRFGIPKLRPRSLRPLAVVVGGSPDAWLFTGCVMDAWMRDTHRSTARLMEATGARIARPAANASCCGALHVHAGREREARRLARKVVASMPGDAPIVVNSAGCGAAMKEYGHLLGTPEADRVRDTRPRLLRVARGDGPIAARAAIPHRRRPGSLPPPSRAEGPRCGADGARLRLPACARPMTTVSAVVPAVPTPCPSRSSPATSVTASCTPSSAQVQPSPAQSSHPRTRVVSCTSAPRVSTSVTPPTSSPRRCPMSDCG